MAEQNTIETDHQLVLEHLPIVHGDDKLQRE
jgi:hypothetical protein